MSGKPAARVGDKVAGNVIVSGSATVLIGDAGQGCADGACKGSPSVGSPVNPMLGIKVLSGETDFALAAPSPFVFTRSYASDDARIGPLGQGWSIPGASLYLEVSETATVMVDPQGRRITFDALAPGESLFSPSESLWIRRGGPVPGEGAPPPKAWDGRWIGVPEAVQRDPNAIVAMGVSGNDAFVFLAGPTRWRLVQVVDRNSYSTEYQWSATGDLRAIRDSAGRVYALVYAAHRTTLEGDSGLRLAGVVLAFDPGRDDKPRSTFDPLAKDNDWLVRYGYDAEGDLVEVIDRMGQSVRYFGYRQHIMVRHGQPNGMDVRYTYDTYSPQGKVLTQRNLEGLDYSFEYRRDRTIVTDSLGRVETYHFAGEAGLRRVVKHVRADGSELVFMYDTAGRLVARSDAMGRTVRYRLDGAGSEIGLTRPDRSTQVFRHDPRSGDLSEVIDAMGQSVHFQRDARGNLLAHTDRAGVVTQYYYDPENMPDRPRRIIDAKGGITRMTWSRLGQLIQKIDCSGHVTGFAYDSRGRLIQVVDALGNVTSYRYDDSDHLIERICQDGTRFGYEYDGLGRLCAATDPAAQVIRFDHDRAGRVVRCTGMLGRRVNFSYDKVGRLRKFINEIESVFHFEYDALDRLVEETGFDGRCRRFSYNPAGELIRIEEVAENRVTCLERDVLGRVVMLGVPATNSAPDSVHTFRYDELGQLVEAISPDVAVYWKFDAMGRRVSERQCHADGWQYGVAHEYDTLGVKTKTVFDGAPEIEWLTYGSGHVHGVRVGDWRLDLERNALHQEVERRLLKSDNYTGLHAVSGYDAMGRLSIQGAGHEQNGEAVWKWGREYWYDRLGQLVRVRDDRVGDIQYDHDPAGQLIGSTHAGRKLEYHYDAAGHRVDSFALSEKQEDRGDGRIRILNGIRYRHDAAGNVIERISESGERLDFSYDGLCRLIAVQSHHSSGEVRFSVKYRYDALGRRVSKEVCNSGGLPPKVTRWGWDGDHLVADCEEDCMSTVIYGPAGHIPWLRLYGKVMAREGFEMSSLMQHPTRVATGLPSAGLQSNGSLALTAYFVDSLGTPLVLCNDKGIPVWSGVSSDWSGVQTVAGEWQPIRFQGQTEDPETGLHYNRHRYFDPMGGIYLSQDPLGLSGGALLYAYVNNSPLSMVDPSGLLEGWSDTSGPPDMTAPLGIKEDGKGDTSVCKYYDDMGKKSPSCGYYKEAAKICRGEGFKGGLTNARMRMGMADLATRSGGTVSRAATLGTIRNSLIQSDAAHQARGDTDANGCVRGNLVDAYHEKAFEKAGINPAYYGGNSWPQNLWPNPVPLDPSASRLDPRRLW